MAPSPPFVNRRAFLTEDVGSTPALICGSEHAMDVDSISFCNTSGNDLFFDIKRIGERMRNNVLTPVELYEVFHGLLKANQTLDIELSRAKYLEPGDLLYANSDFSGSRFDSVVSCREYNELEGNQ